MGNSPYHYLYAPQIIHQINTGADVSWVEIGKGNKRKLLNFFTLLKNNTQFTEKTAFTT